MSWLREEERQQAELVRQETQRTELFRRVFGTDEGKLVLSIIRQDLGYFSRSDKPELVEYAKQLISRVYPVSGYSVVDALSRVTPRTTRED
jgi:hypothetical protein